jgi:hypothetical protein
MTGFVVFMHLHYSLYSSQKTIITDIKPDKPLIAMFVAMLKEAVFGG